ncbi:hypothetical protein BDY19DRAFT_1032245 [Irpex rosettiformis]|uniref:Uncharacterized protein n=1 Tax=Irpex rosettiformis TaxID=378272 RepID=A0ACB8TN58_9APHY|nr:hypothetical protein BDY19DRAFT_1032245 [Irpex rosettiformis]
MRLLPLFVSQKAESPWSRIQLARSTFAGPLIVQNGKISFGLREQLHPLERVHPTEMKALISNYELYSTGLIWDVNEWQCKKHEARTMMRLVLLPRTYPSSLVVAAFVGPLVRRKHLSVGELSCAPVWDSIWKRGSLHMLRVQRLRLIGLAEYYCEHESHGYQPLDVREQVQDMDEEDASSDLREGRGLVDSSPESDSELERRASLSPPGYTSPHADASVSDGTIALHTQDASDATALGTQSYHNPIFPTTPQPNSWEPASTRIPPELFDTILFYLCLGYNPGRWSNDTSSCRQITMCSLVCIRWANLCRQVLFCKRKLTIHSSEEVQTFVKYATQGCPSLIPIHTLIESISVEQRYDIRYSFCNRIYMLKAKYGIRLFELMLIGPVPEGFPSSGLDTPHWGLSPSVITPPSLLSYDEITVEDVHLPSFRHVVKYVRHFAQAGSIDFNHLTWDTDGQEPQLPFYRRGSHKVKNRSLYMYAEECTDNFLLCLVVAAIHPRWRSVMCMLPDDESQWIAIMIRWFRELWGKKNKWCTLRIQEESEELSISVIISHPEVPDWGFHFHLCNLAAENAQTSDVHVIHTSTHSYGVPPTSVIQSSASEWLGLHVPRADKYDYVEIDPITLSPTGRSWVDEDSFDSHDLGFLLPESPFSKQATFP